jgi:hypothetical protein
MMTLSILSVLLTSGQFAAATSSLSIPHNVRTHLVSGDRPLDTNLTILRLDGPTWEGDLTVWILPTTERTEMNVSLAGRVWAKGKTGEEYAYDARFDFQMPVEEGVVVPLGDSHALSIASDPAILLQRKEIARDVVAWTSRSPEIAGTLEVWHAPEDTLRLSDAQVLAIFSAMFDTRDREPGRQAGCPSNAQACANLAKSTCDPNRVGSVSYSCNASTKQESCSFTCLSSPPGGGD